MLFNEPKLLKFCVRNAASARPSRFSALQRAEIAEIRRARRRGIRASSFSALQRAEIAEIAMAAAATALRVGFSALQRAEIAEIELLLVQTDCARRVSVLFNEPKLLKSATVQSTWYDEKLFQCSSTSRNC